MNDYINNTYIEINELIVSMGQLPADEQWTIRSIIIIDKLNQLDAPGNDGHLEHGYMHQGDQIINGYRI